MFFGSRGKEQAAGAVYCCNYETKLDHGHGFQPDRAPAIAVEYAGLQKRFLAWIIDIIVVNAIVLLVGFILKFSLLSVAKVEETTASNVIDIMSVVAGFFGSWLYYTICESSSRQATMGKTALGIIVTDYKGKKISFLRATVRHFTKILSLLIFFTGFIMIAFTRNKQGLHDIIAKTMVVSK